MLPNMTSLLANVQGTQVQPTAMEPDRRPRPAEMQGDAQGKTWHESAEFCVVLALSAHRRATMLHALPCPRLLSALGAAVVFSLVLSWCELLCILLQVCSSYP